MFMNYEWKVNPPTLGNWASWGSNGRLERQRIVWNVFGETVGTKETRFWTAVPTFIKRKGCVARWQPSRSKKIVKQRRNAESVVKKITKRGDALLYRSKIHLRPAIWKAKQEIRQSRSCLGKRLQAKRFYQTLLKVFRKQIDSFISRASFFPSERDLFANRIKKVCATFPKQKSQPNLFIWCLRKQSVERCHHQI